MRVEFFIKKFSQVQGSTPCSCFKNKKVLTGCKLKEKGVKVNINKLEELVKIKKLANKIDLDVLYLGERSSKFDRMAFIAGSKLKEALIATETALKAKE